MDRKHNTTTYYGDTDDGYSYERAKEDALKLIRFLLDDAERHGEHETYSIRVTPRKEMPESVTVDWDVCGLDYDWGVGGFEWVGSGDEVVSTLEYPDGSCQYVPVGSDPREMLSDWLRSHKGWRKDDAGNWSNVVDDALVQADFSHAKWNAEPFSRDVSFRNAQEMLEDDRGDVLRRTGYVIVGKSVAKALGHRLEGDSLLMWKEAVVPATMFQGMWIADVPIIGSKDVDRNAVLFVTDGGYLIDKRRYVAPKEGE